jgi:hypothetical protein
MTSGNLGYDYTKWAALDYTSYYYETNLHRPASYGKVTGNFDGAGGSYGIIQFNWKSNTIQPILKDMFNYHNTDMAAVFTSTADYNTLYDVVFNRTTTEQISWGDSITILNADGTRSNKVIDIWNTYFTNLGTYTSYQERQIVSVDSTYWANAKTWVSDFGLWTRRGYALCFDIAVQYGGISTTAHTDIINFAAGLPGNLTAELKELRLMRYIANRVAQDHSGGTFSGVAFDRKRAIANGNGLVYGYPAPTYDYDLILEPNGILGIPDLKKPRWVRRFRFKKGS